MEKFLQRALQVAGLCAVLALGACGGGGGGGTSGSGSGPSVSLLSAATITDLTYEGLPAHPTGFELGIGGDLGILSTHALYIKVVQPEELFIRDFTFVPAGSTSVSVSLLGNSNHPLPAGHTTGTLQVYACLDDACTTQLQNSPVAVAYDLEARPGVHLSTNLIDETVNFGEKAPAQTISVSLPAGVTNWSLTAMGKPAGAADASTVVVTPWLQRNAGTPTLSFTPTVGQLDSLQFAYQAGLYAQDYQVTAFVPDLKTPSQNVQIQAPLGIRHRIVATGAVLVQPAAEVRTVSLGALDPGYPLPAVVSQVGGFFSRRGVRTDSFPPEAAGNPLLAKWLVPDDQLVVINPIMHTEQFCDLSTYPKTCLPTGTYRGAILARHTASDGTVTDFEYPVSVTLVP